MGCRDSHPCAREALPAPASTERANCCKGNNQGAPQISETVSSLKTHVTEFSGFRPPKFSKIGEFYRPVQRVALDEGLAIVCRNHEIDLAALAAALKTKGAGYIGMIGSSRKVQRVFERETGKSLRPIWSRVRGRFTGGDCG